MAEPVPQVSRNEKAGTIALLCAAAVTICLPLTKVSEGTRTRTYWDPAHIATYCTGETANVDWTRIYTNDECDTLLRKRLAQDYAPVIAGCLPQVARPERIHVFGALLDAAYNAGPAAVCNSRMARSVRAGDLRGACNGFYGWFTTARDRRTGRRFALRGLVIRRQKEAALCMLDVRKVPV